MKPLQVKMSLFSDELSSRGKGPRGKKINEPAAGSTPNRTCILSPSKGESLAIGSAISYEATPRHSHKQSVLVGGTVDRRSIGDDISNSRGRNRVRNAPQILLSEGQDVSNRVHAAFLGLVMSHREVQYLGGRFKPFQADLFRMVYTAKECSSFHEIAVRNKPRPVK